ncbi:MAG: hypothetical protein ABSG38_01735 [Spirochaetia bacterium]|jgi:hypothetical protein
MQNDQLDSTFLVTVIGFVAARWRRGKPQDAGGVGLAGRRFGTEAKAEA